MGGAHFAHLYLTCVFIGWSHKAESDNRYRDNRRGSRCCAAALALTDVSRYEPPPLEKEFGISGGFAVETKSTPEKLTDIFIRNLYGAEPQRGRVIELYFVRLPKLRDEVNLVKSGADLRKLVRTRIDALSRVSQEGLAYEMDLVLLNEVSLPL